MVLQFGKAEALGLFAGPTSYYVLACGYPSYLANLTSNTFLSQLVAFVLGGNVRRAYRIVGSRPLAPASMFI
jgi:hypothetical protein